MRRDLSRRDFLAASVSAGAAMALGARGAAASPSRVRAGTAFGGTWRMVTRAEAPEGVEAVLRAAVAEIDRLMSPWRPDSALTRFNRAEGRDWHPVEEQVARLVTAALRLHDETGGAYDPTVGPLVHRYGFGPIEGRHAGVAALEAGPDRLRKTDPRATLDLCGIAKGYALDRIVADLRRSGVSDALIELGGEVRSIGRHPSGRAWRVGLQLPGAGGQRVQRVIAPGTLAVATSGHAVQGYEGRHGTLSHIVDPRSGHPADPRLASVTVLDEDAARADALATALTVMGPAAGPRFAADRGLAALFLIRDRPEAAPREILTGPFEAHLLA